ncbi:uncharacterized protein LOC111699535 isoform X2 [Eurytemora carolleeae]|uniref:uncharacterized protein LOC111699535 isoform X2 n=1 Tax=Eurytemora carolleeae TaxID=1294199 RepID=UPI000C7946A7|nr:uncharacterized protein LOC111699535 isoform X2 [Eurytemora carolleeae]|eukprot:XP_023326001.1 uncharacterized protein LOC111699535 isoform X2 [Eurytemora affinis]
MLQLILLIIILQRTGEGKPQYLELGGGGTSIEEAGVQSEQSGEQEETQKIREKIGAGVQELHEALKTLPDSKAALLEMKVKDNETNSTKTQNFLYLPKSFQYTITNCFCGGNCQEIHDPETWKCNDTCRRICKTPCTVCGTRQT